MTAAIVSIGSALRLAQQQAPAQTPDADGIYAAVLPTVSSLPRNEFFISQNTVPYANTEKAFPVDPNNITSKEQFEAQLRNATREEQMRLRRQNTACIQVPDAERDLYVSAMQDYLRKNAASIELQPTFVLAKPYRLLKDDETKQVEIAEQGVFRVSAVGFSSDKSIGIVYVGFDCMLCGRWALHVLERVNGKWQELPTSCRRLS